MRRLKLPSAFLRFGRRPPDREAPAARRVQPRPRVAPWWRTWKARATLATTSAFVLAIVALWGWHNRWPQRAADWGYSVVRQVETGLGLAVADVWVVGRQETPRRDLIDAMDVATGDPILEVDLASVRDRVRDLSWVQEVSIRRVLPDRLIVDIRERRPMALWQHHGHFSLIDPTGEVLTRDDLDRFKALPTVVGPDAPKFAAALLDVLRREPEMFERVKAAVRFGGRRWNLHFDGNTVVRLPETGVTAAWLRLADYQRRHGMLDKDVEVIDLRFPDQVIVRMKGGLPTAPQIPGRST